MKTAIIGAGAMGTLFGGLLANDGNDVWLIHHRDSYAREIDDAGITILGPSGEASRTQVQATADAATVGHVELAIILVRSYQTMSAVREHESCIGPDTRVLSLQNGLTNHEWLKSHFGSRRTLSGVTYQAATVEGPGRVTHTNSGRTIVGGSDTEFMERVRQTFERAGINVTVVKDPAPALWKKQLWGAALKPVSALTGLRIGELVRHDEIATVLQKLILEAATVAEAHGVDIDAQTEFETMVDDLSASTHRSSMLQDIETDRRTEIDEINGAIVELGDDAGIDVSYNRVMTALVHGLERRKAD